MWGPSLTASALAGTFGMGRAGPLLKLYRARTAGRNMTKSAYAAVAGRDATTAGDIDLPARTVIIRNGRQGEGKYFIAAGEAFARTIADKSLRATAA